jgi:hypothetical protein
MSDLKKCPICHANLTAWAEMTSDTGVSIAATCPNCKTFVVPEGFLARLDSLEEDARWDVCARVSIAFKTTGEAVTLGDEHLEG